VTVADEGPDDDITLAPRSAAPTEPREEDPRVERLVQRAADRLLHLSYSFSGPLPPPQMLAGYERVQPGLAERLVSMTEREQAFRHTAEQKMIDNDVARSRNGQWFAFIIAVLLALIAGGLIYTDHDMAGAFLGTVDIVGLVAVFITGKLTSRSEEIEKARILAQVGRHAARDDEDEDDE
jgi:uncharacterized membrane protein